MRRVETYDVFLGDPTWIGSARNPCPESSSFRRVFETIILYYLNEKHDSGYNHNGKSVGGRPEFFFVTLQREDDVARRTAGIRIRGRIRLRFASERRPRVFVRKVRQRSNKIYAYINLRVGRRPAFKAAPIWI